MTDLDREIYRLRAEGMSLRFIGNVVGKSRMWVARRLAAMKKPCEGGTREAGEEPKGNKCHRGGKAHLSKGLPRPGVSERGVSHEKAPSPSSGDGVTPRPKGRGGPHRGKIEGNSSCSDDDLAADLIRFLEGRGEVYRMQTPSAESYQIKHLGQTIRLYIQRHSQENQKDKGVA